MVLRDQELPVASEIYFREATRLDPEDEINHYYLGLSLRDQGRFVEAEACFREAVRLSPEDATNHY